ncbi:UNVERIFIED_CONTAM: hypothetical protein HDU68_007551 [Siphonaria sp. JEL0065]|nr:hypothetical protein HDU68_007551 [Siphonaria sp. JEL0065]
MKQKSIPVEVLANILSFVDATDTVPLRLLCRMANQILNERETHIAAFGEACARNFHVDKLNASLEVIPQELFELSALRSLDLARSNLTGRVPLEFQHLEKLKILILSFNNFTGEVIGDTQLLENDWKRYKFHLVTLDLSHNNFTGPIPDVFRTCYVLESLDLSHNKLSGCISPEVHGWIRIKNLNLENNCLDGEIPDCIGISMRRLEKLLLTGNRLSGKIPASLGNEKILKALNTVLLGQNRFVGEFTVDLVNKLPRLAVLDVSHNKLEGKIDDCLIKKVDGEGKGGGSGAGLLLKQLVVNGNRDLDVGGLVAWARDKKKLKVSSKKEQRDGPIIQSSQKAPTADLKHQPGANVNAALREALPAATSAPTTNNSTDPTQFSANDKQVDETTKANFHAMNWSIKTTKVASDFNWSGFEMHLTNTCTKGQ